MVWTKTFDAQKWLLEVRRAVASLSRLHLFLYILGPCQLEKTGSVYGACISLASIPSVRGPLGRAT